MLPSRMTAMQAAAMLSTRSSSRGERRAFLLQLVRFCREPSSSTFSFENTN